MSVGKTMAGIRNRTFMSLVVLASLLLGATSAFSQVVACRPLLSTMTVREVRTPSQWPLPWRWHATIVADTSFCAVRSGNFEIDFVRIKEYAPDQQFTQTFRWSQDQFDISMELSPDEAILEFRNRIHRAMRLSRSGPAVARATRAVSRPHSRQHGKPTF